MGYRLEISRITYAEIGGGKLFGYVDDVTKLRSHKWLLDRDLIDGTEYWSYGCNPQIVLSKKEFKDFMDLYWKDIIDVYGAYPMPKRMNDLIEENCDKLLEWL